MCEIKRQLCARLKLLTEQKNKANCQHATAAADGGEGAAAAAGGGGVSASA